MSDPTLENKAASIVNQILKELIEGAGESVVEATLIAQFPWLGLPFVKQIFEFILDKASGLIYQNAAMAATKIVIDIQVNQEESAVKASFDNLQMALASGDAHAIEIASADLSKSYAAIIHFDGSASP